METDRKSKAVRQEKDGSSFTPIILTIAWCVAAISTCMIFYLLDAANKGNLLFLAGKGIPKGSPDTYASKLEFTAKYWILPLIWLKFNIWMVIAKRVPSRAINPLDGHEEIVMANKNILTNTLEQMVASLVTQLSLLTYLSLEEVVKFIPLLNILYFIGRITFWLGYPRFRTFGFMTTSLPTTIGVIYCAYRFYQFFP